MGPTEHNAFDNNYGRERRRGRVVRALGCGAEGRRFESRLGPKDWKTLTVFPAANGYLINFREG